MRRAFFLVACGAIACNSSSGTAPPPKDGGGAEGGEAAPPGPAAVSFPGSFLWGTATAGFQVEKGDANTDWSHWVAMAGKIANGDNPDVGGPDALNHVDEDIQGMKSIGLGAYRFSIEWGRVYPTLADFTSDTPDPAGLAAYDTLIQKLGAAGIKPMVTLFHWALPDYLDDLTQPNTMPHGWEVQQTSDLFVEWCTRVAKRWGGQVDWWVTLNEPQVLPLIAYVQGGFPPGVLLGVDRALAVIKAETTAHARCFDAIHAADTLDADGDGHAAWVSVAAHQRTFHPLDPSSADDQAATTHVEYLWNRWILNAIVLGNWDDDFNGDLTGPNDRTGDATLKGRADYIGLNYYSDTLISAHKGIVLPLINAAVTLTNLPTGRPETDVAWDIYPEGFGTVLDEAATYGQPIVVTENGIADRADANRSRFLAEHLYQLGWAMQRGADVRGYFHWSLMDNFEWINGFCPKFGFFSVDPITAARTARPSAQMFAHLIAAGKVVRADIDAMPPYAKPIVCQ